MELCHICMEHKPRSDFKKISHFRDVQRNKVQWCRECQKMWLNMKKEQENAKKYEIKDKSVFIVSFN